METLDLTAVPADVNELREAVSVLLMFVVFGVLPIASLIVGWRRRAAMTPAEREREDRGDADNWADRHW